ncbi:alpha mannosidase-like protein [Crepidotus variabilis]|uniref:alpha-1,2-Mannosidase n=1 Tax=Crepidotus variabilis TaxID=179855 RepID=A0A9P6ERM7_9AGAR|nr:alpha mannosidase-like protein [Crepidotus variabilis]
MTGGWYWRESIFVAILLAANSVRWFLATEAASVQGSSSGWTPQRTLNAREKTRELWYHGFNNYMTFAFPLDELTPLSCSGQGPDWANPSNIAANDVAGNFSLTLIDVLDTLVVLGDRPGFETAVKNVIEWVSFDVDTKPQVFEVTIRVLGGLLSGHIFASREDQPFHLPWYRDELLTMAHDLGKRLLPAFSTPTGLPFARINLRRGVMKGETVETCTAGAGSLILEFATLSRLTGDDRFEKAAYRAFFGIWNRRSDVGLVGNTIDTRTGRWMFPETTGIGAGIDSFYEYALKWYIMSGELEFLDVWDDAYAAIMRYARAKDGYWFRTVNMQSGDPAYLTIDSLSAFWPGLQVLAGDIQNAIKLHMIYYNLWKQHSGLPEVYDTHYKQATSHQYPLRPEFIESTWYLYRATRDPFYLDVGERVLFDLTTRAKVPCGLSGIRDLRNNTRDDRMESFALSETLKYLYLLFDEENPLHSDDSNYVLTTEGHILSLEKEHLKPVPAVRRRMRKLEDHQCPAYRPSTLANEHSTTRPGLTVGVRSRADVDYPHHLTGTTHSVNDERYWHSDGWCEKPKVDPYSFEFILAPHGRTVPEDLSPSLVKLAVVQDGYVIHNVTGIRTHIVQRLDGKGYDVRKLGHYSVRSGHTVYINDSTIFAHPGEESNIAQDELHRREAQVQLRVFTTESDTLLSSIQNIATDGLIDVSITGYTAQFGADLSSNYVPTKPTEFIATIKRPEGLPVRREPSNLLGCSPFKESYPNSAIIVHRGDCTFLEKLLNAHAAMADAIVIVSNENFGVNPTASPEELETAGNIDDVAMILLPKKTGDLFEEMIIATEGLKMAQIRIAIEPKVEEEEPEVVPPMEKEQEKAHDRILYINGHPLINTRLLI